VKEIVKGAKVLGASQAACIEDEQVWLGLCILAVGHMNWGATPRLAGESERLDVGSDDIGGGASGGQRVGEGCGELSSRPHADHDGTALERTVGPSVVVTLEDRWKGDR
jgi:hypothetical protein